MWAIVMVWSVEPPRQRHATNKPHPITGRALAPTRHKVGYGGVARRRDDGIGHDVIKVWGSRCAYRQDGWGFR